MSSANPSFLTPVQYLDLERKAEIKSEYINGRMYAMSGASFRHNLIVANLLSAITAQLRGKKCRAVASDQRVKIAAAGVYAYPDIVAVCDEPHFEDKLLDTLLNPTMIVEVLSPSTEAYDRGEKFVQYRRMETLQEYVLVSQNRIRIELFRREGDHWILTELNTPDAVLHLESINCHIELAAIYENVDFTT